MAEKEDETQKVVPLVDLLKERPVPPDKELDEAPASSDNEVLVDSVFRRFALWVLRRGN